MPRNDQTGPMGTGCMKKAGRGRGMGCQGRGQPNGFGGNGFGGNGFGRGRGLGCFSSATKDDQIASIEKQIELLGVQLKALKE